jgi:uncharacterized RDD family membrane protein YckC
MSDMTLADKGARLGNFIVDTVVLGVIILTLNYIMYFFFPEFADNDYPIFDIGLLILCFSYYFFAEFFWGRTVGKIFTKTIVVDQHGNKPKIFKLIIRTLFRFFPVEGFTFLFGSGLHDQVSGTIVVKM